MPALSPRHPGDFGKRQRKPETRSDPSLGPSARLQVVPGFSSEDT